jgi:hypothetical protein
MSDDFTSVHIELPVLGATRDSVIHARHNGTGKLTLVIDCSGWEPVDKQLACQGRWDGKAKVLTLEFAPEDIDEHGEGRAG